MKKQADPPTGNAVGTPAPRPDWLPTTVWPFETRHINVQGMRIGVTDVGSGPTLLFVNAGQWSFIWRDVITRLADRFRCVTLDPPCFGQSDVVPKDRQTLATVRDVVGAVIDQLDLRDVTLVLHDLGGVTSLAAASPRADRIAGVVAANTFGWRPSGPLFRGMLAMVGSAPMRELDAFTNFLPAATTSRFGVGKHMDKASKKAFRKGMHKPARRAMHRLFKNARKSPEVYRQADEALNHRLAGRPVLTVFGALGDYLGFQSKWRARVPSVRQVVVPRGLHFPMTDDPDRVANAIASWHAETIGR